jgi:AraC family L-rhamnose operon transcriptional activator RhaR/AraC family L-rhamnose operon regulatory protein RhaS
MMRLLKKEEWFHEDGFPIAVARRNPQTPFGIHAHEFCELVIITQGRGHHVTGEDSWELTAGDVFVIGGARPHDYLNMDNLCLINILYEPDRLGLNYLDLPSIGGYHALFTLEPAFRGQHQFKSRLHLLAKDLAIAVELVDRLEGELKRREAGFGFMATALFMQLIGFLSRCYMQSQHPDGCALLRIGEAISHMESHFDEPMCLETLAKIARMPKRSFLRAFHLATGTSPVAYVIQLRILRAASLLREKNSSITDIAFDVGFGDSNYFTRQFRKVQGVSPRDYRRIGSIGKSFPNS